MTAQNLPIASIELRDFMSHTHTVLELAAGVTLLYGGNNCGKSAVVEAVLGAARNDAQGYVVRHGAPQATVTLETGDGHTVVWNRTAKSAWYEIDGESHARFGRGAHNLPDALHAALKLPMVGEDEPFEVHFGLQKEPIFLLNTKASGRKAAEFLGLSSDAGKLLQIQKLHEQRTRERKSRRADLARELASVEQELEALAPAEALLALLDHAESERAAIEDAAESAIRLAHRIDALDHQQTEHDELEARQRGFASLTPPPELHDLQSPEALIDGLTSLADEVEVSRARERPLTMLEEPPSLQPESEIGALVATIEQNAQLIRGLQAEAEALGDLEHPPTLEDSTRLSRLVDRLDAQREALRTTEAEATLLLALHEPPELAATHLLLETIEAFEVANTSIASLQADHKSHLDALGKLEHAIAAWLEAHPECPTCGQTLPGGGHRHD